MVSLRGDKEPTNFIDVEDEEKPLGQLAVPVLTHKITYDAGIVPKELQVLAENIKNFESQKNIYDKMIVH